MTFGKVSTPTLRCSLHSKQFLSPLQLLKCKWDLMNLVQPRPSMKKFEPLALKKMWMKKWWPRLQLQKNLKFLSMRNLRLRFLRWYCKSLTLLSPSQRIPSPRSQNSRLMISSASVYSSLNSTPMTMLVLEGSVSGLPARPTSIPQFSLTRTKSSIMSTFLTWTWNLCLASCRFSVCFTMQACWISALTSLIRMKSLFFSSTQLCISHAMLLTSTHGCWTGWLKTHIRRHQPLNCFVPCQSVLHLTVLVVCMMSLNSLITIYKCSWRRWSRVKPQEPNSSWRNCSMCQGQSTAF